jgi:hypothetical protein
MTWPDVDTDCWFDKVYYELIINDTGKILRTNLIIGDAHCNDNNRIIKMQEKLKLNLDEIVLKLPIWKPAVVNGEKVTAKYIYSTAIGFCNINRIFCTYSSSQFISIAIAMQRNSSSISHKIYYFLNIKSYPG